MGASRFLCFVVAVTLVGCAPSAPRNVAGSSIWPPTEPVPVGWKRIQVGEAFSFDAPADTQPVSLHGIDSAVGGYKNDRFNVTFDYGAYSNSLSHLGRLSMATKPA
jgi:hypothetical protein